MKSLATLLCALLLAPAAAQAGGSDGPRPLLRLDPVLAGGTSWPAPSAPARGPGGALLAQDREAPGPQGPLGLAEPPAADRGLVQALWRSAVLPGWGERYLGAPGRGWIFMGAEAVTWGTWGTFKTQEWLRRENYIEMAQVFAGVGGEDYEDEYWKIVGQHESWLDYNEYLRYQARREYGFGTASYYDYIAEHEIAAADAWTWGSQTRRFAYADKRQASKDAERRATYTLYALLVNRVISLVDTYRLWRTHEAVRARIGAERGGLDLSARPTPDGLGWRLSWSRSF